MDTAFEGKYIKFLENTHLATKKTKHWTIISTDDGSILGGIKWFGRWRGYAFFPCQDTVYEKVCLRDIAEFIEKQTKEHYNQLKIKKENKNGEKRETEKTNKG